MKRPTKRWSPSRNRDGGDVVERLDGAPAMIYRCTGCGSTSERWSDRCIDCGERATLRPYAAAFGANDEPPKRGLAAVRSKRMPHIATGLLGFDRIIGEEPHDGGFTVPSMVVLGGGQGAGKSSLAIQAMAGIASHVGVLYLLNEEPAMRLRARADRVGLRERDIEHIDVCESKYFADYKRAIAKYDPRVIVLDSISMMKDPVDHGGEDTGDEQGNLMRYAQWFFDDAMANRRVMLAIAHLTKADDIAGVRKMQYLVDAVATITKVGNHHSVLECPDKNRFGSVGTRSFFSIGKEGLRDASRKDALDAAKREAKEDAEGDEVY